MHILHVEDDDIAAASLSLSSDSSLIPVAKPKIIIGGCDEEAGFSRYSQYVRSVRLQPANVTMDPIYVDAARVQVQGRVVGVLRTLFY